MCPGDLSLPLALIPFEVQAVALAGIGGRVGVRPEGSLRPPPLNAGKAREATEVSQSSPEPQGSRRSPHPRPAKAAAQSVFFSALKQNPRSFLPPHLAALGSAGRAAFG